MSEAGTLLTIGIPTFERGPSVAQRLREISTMALPPHVEVLVIDNASQDRTYDELTREFGNHGFRILRNDTNIGYSGNLFRLFDEARGRHLIVVSDEDELLADGLREVLALCESAGPAFISPQAEARKIRLYRGRNRTRAIRPDEVRAASFYVSGLTFHVPRSRGHVARLRSLIEENLAVRLYPQVLLAALAVAEDHGIFLAAGVTRQIERLPTRIADETGGSFKGVASRWAQLRDYEKFYTAELTGVEPRDSRIRAMRDEVRRSVVSTLTTAVRAESSDFAQTLPLSILRAALDRRVLLQALRAAIGLPRSH